MFPFFSAQKTAQRIIEALPVADIQGSRDGPTLLITAGLDGDEYAGIEAAFEAAQKYAVADFSGRLIVLPIVNTPGFEAGVSENPLDNKFPKYCIPGRAHGSVTERLMHHVVETYAQRAVFWLDLHSGALDEVTISCLWNTITGNAVVDARGEGFARISGAMAAVREPAHQGTEILAEYGCTYVMAESEDAEQHTTYIERAMQQLGMLPGIPAELPIRIFLKAREVKAPKGGIWNPEEYKKTLPGGEILLWHTVPGVFRTGGRVGEIAYDEQRE